MGRARARQKAWGRKVHAEGMLAEGAGVLASTGRSLSKDPNGFLDMAEIFVASSAELPGAWRPEGFDRKALEGDLKSEARKAGPDAIVWFPVDGRDAWATRSAPIKDFTGRFVRSAGHTARFVERPVNGRTVAIVADQPVLVDRNGLVIEWSSVNRGSAVLNDVAAVHPVDSLSMQSLAIVLEAAIRQGPLVTSAKAWMTTGLAATAMETVSSAEMSTDLRISNIVLQDDTSVLGPVEERGTFLITEAYARLASLYRSMRHFVKDDSLAVEFARGTGVTLSEVVSRPKGEDPTWTYVQAAVDRILQGIGLTWKVPERAVRVMVDTRSELGRRRAEGVLAWAKSGQCLGNMTAGKGVVSLFDRRPIRTMIFAKSGSLEVFAWEGDRA